MDKRWVVGVTLLAGSAALLLMRGLRPDTPHPTPGEGAGPTLPYSAGQVGGLALEGRSRATGLPAATPAERPAVVFIVKDVFSRSPVAGAVVESGDRDSHSVKSYRTDSAGRVYIDRAEELATLTVTSPWCSATSANGQAAIQDGVCWVYGVVTVRGQIVAEHGQPPDLSSANLSVFAPQHYGRDTEESAVGSLSWMRRWGLQRQDYPQGMGRDGSFQLLVPRLPGYFLVCRHPTLGACFQQLQFDPQSDVMEGVRLVMRQPLVLAGRLMDESREPIGDVGVQFSGVLHGSAAELDAWYVTAQLFGFSSGIICHGEDGGCEFFCQGETITSASGSYALAVPVSGMELELRVLAPGHSPKAVSLGRFDDSRANLEVVLGLVDLGRGRAQFSYRGQPLTKGHASAYLAEEERTSVMDLGSADANGTFGVEWLTVGRVYYVTVLGADGVRHAGFLRWDGRLRVDVEDLSPDRAAVK